MRGDHLKEVPNIHVAINFDLETFGILEKWLLRRAARLQEVAATRGSTVYMYRRGGDRSQP